MEAITHYVADRCDLPAAGLTRAEIVERLQSARIRPEDVAETDALLETCENACYAGAAAAGPNDIMARASALIERLEHEHLC
jgi:hypothetical protein